MQTGFLWDSYMYEWVISIYMKDKVTNSPVIRQFGKLKWILPPLHKTTSRFILYIFILYIAILTDILQKWIGWTLYNQEYQCVSYYKDKYITVNTQITLCKEE